jgi:hypothetical protein
VIDRSAELLFTLEPATQERAWWLLYAARRAGIPLVLISGRRSPEVNVDVGGAERSWHLSGAGFDVQVLGYRVAELDPSWWQAVGLWAEANLGLYWGGRFRDLNHFDGRRYLTSV